MSLGRPARGITCARARAIFAFSAVASAAAGSIPIALPKMPVAMPPGVSVETPNPTTIVLKGADKQAVGHIAAVIRKIRKPEPYKGKGIRYKDEFVFRKEGKKK